MNALILAAVLECGVRLTGLSCPATTAVELARAWPDAHEGLLARTYGPPGLEEDIAFCARVSVLDVVPRLNRMVEGAAEIVSAPLDSKA